MNLTPDWLSVFPGAHAGILILHDVENPEQHPALEAKKKELEEELRARFGALSRQEILEEPTLRAYAAYYKKFTKTYHVQLQLESLVHKGKDIPRVAALVEAMFMAEMKNLFLTAGHDLAAVRMPITLDVARGDESYTLLRGVEQVLKAGDMYIRDQRGILSSILYGPDERTRITPTTRQTLFTVYAPAGIAIEAIQAHLVDIASYACLVAPEAQILELKVYPE